MTFINIIISFKNIGAKTQSVFFGKIRGSGTSLKGNSLASRILAKVPFKLCGKLQVQLPPVAETIETRFSSIKL